MRRLITAPAAMRAPLPSPPPGRPTVCRDKVASLHADRHNHRCGDIVFYPEGPPPTRPPKKPTGHRVILQGPRVCRLLAGARRIRTLGPSRESVGPCGRRGNAEALKRDGLVKACRAPFPGCAEKFHTTHQTALSCCRRRPSRSRSVRSLQRRSALPPEAARSVRGSTAAKAGTLRWRPITMAV
jgi:hypothetical protein